MMMTNQQQDDEKERRPEKRRKQQRPPKNLLLRLVLCIGIIVVATFQVYINIQWHQQQDQKQQHRQSVSQPKRRNINHNPKFAYVFLVSGCDPKSPLQYRNYLYNILVAARNLRQEEDDDKDQGKKRSTSDVIVMIQFANSVVIEHNNNNNNNSTNNTSPLTLPPGDTQWLEFNNIIIHYLPPLVRDNFYNAQLEKFQILQLVDYDRVMYLDADVMPITSLDYLMEYVMMDNDNDDISHPTPNNLILAWFTEPAQGGLFVLEPGLDYWKEFQAILRRREEDALKLPYPHWDPIVGWGQEPLQEPWKGIPQPLNDHNDVASSFAPPRTSTNWTFHGDFADQGLLYYWTAIHEHHSGHNNNKHQSVAIVFLDEIEEYKAGKLLRRVNNTNGRAFCKKQNHHHHHPYLFGDSQFGDLFVNKIPHRDFVHFTGDTKPWEDSSSSSSSKSSYHQFPTTISPTESTAKEFWYYQLGKIFDEFQMAHPNRTIPKLPLKFKKPSLGRYPTYRSMIGSIQKKQKKRKEQEEAEEEQQRVRHQ